MQKTILITISRGGTARNILQTDTLQILKKYGNRIVILTPAYNDERFLNEFKDKDVYIEKLIEPRWGFLDKILVGWYKGLVYNSSTKLRDLYGVPGTGKVEDGSLAKYFFKKIFFQPLSKLSFLKKLFRLVDRVLIKDRYYGEIFNNYNPDIVFATSIVEDADAFVMKQAQNRGIKLIGMPKSWDNLSKICSRVRPDKLIVWADYSCNEAIKFQNAKKENVIKCGVPQFDFYKKDEYLMTREEFCRLFDIDFKKKIILFCSEGRNTPYDGEITEAIANFINEGKINQDSVLLIRPHFMYLGDENKFLGVSKFPKVVVDKNYERSKAFKDNWDYSKEQIKRFTNIIYHSDIVITSLSSISLDAAAFNKPIINITFDGYHQLPFGESLKRLYLYEHYQQIMKSGGIWFVDNFEKLLNAINNYLENPTLLSAGRERLRDYFCYKIDGQSGKRVAEAVMNYLGD